MHHLMCNNLALIVFDEDVQKPSDGWLDQVLKLHSRLPWGQIHEVLTPNFVLQTSKSDGVFNVHFYKTNMVLKTSKWLTKMPKLANAEYVSPKKWCFNAKTTFKHIHAGVKVFKKWTLCEGGVILYPSPSVCQMSFFKSDQT